MTGNYHETTARITATLRASLPALTERVADMKTLHLRLQTAIEQLDQTLSGTSKRMYADLAEAAGLWDRMEMLEDPIQFALEFSRGEPLSAVGIDESRADSLLIFRIRGVAEVK